MLQSDHQLVENADWSIMIVWFFLVIGSTELSEFADLGGIFIVPGVTAFAQITNMRETGHWEAD